MVDNDKVLNKKVRDTSWMILRIVSTLTLLSSVGLLVFWAIIQYGNVGNFSNIGTGGLDEEMVVERGVYYEVKSQDDATVIIKTQTAGKVEDFKVSISADEPWTYSTIVPNGSWASLEAFTIQGEKIICQTRVDGVRSAFENGHGMSDKARCAVQAK